MRWSGNETDASMIQTCKFKKGSDIAEVVPGLGVDINNALETGQIRDTSVPAQYNMQKELSDVGNRVHEPFDVIEYERSYTRIRKSVKDEKEKSE